MATKKELFRGQQSVTKDRIVYFKNEYTGQSLVYTSSLEYVLTSKDQGLESDGNLIFITQWALDTFNLGKNADHIVGLLSQAKRLNNEGFNMDKQPLGWIRSEGDPGCKN